MKHNFLLDENILYLAIKGVDDHDNPDSAAEELIRLIAQNCHTITYHDALRYWYHLAGLKGVRSPALEPLFFINELIKNSAKIRPEYSNLPDLPIGAKIPSEDIHVVRIALIARPLIVSSDRELREAINSQASLQLRALTPREALTFATDQ